MDVSDWLNDGATAEDIRAVVTKQKFSLPSKPDVDAVYEDDEEDEELLTAPMADETFT